MLEESGLPLGSSKDKPRPKPLILTLCAWAGKKLLCGGWEIALFPCCAVKTVALYSRLGAGPYTPAAKGISRKRMRAAESK